jgi:hypothetical protein
MIESALAEATRGVDPQIWDTKADDGIRWYTAHLLAISPFGQQARLVSEAGESTYGKRWRELSLEVSSGFRVI